MRRLKLLQILLLTVSIFDIEVDSMNRSSHHTPLQRLTLIGADIQSEHLVKNQQSSCKRLMIRTNYIHLQRC